MKKEESSCSFGDVHNPSEWDNVGQYNKSANGFLGAPEQEQSPIINIKKQASRGRRLRINVTNREGFTDAETKRHVSACKLIEVVVNSAEFKKRVLAKKFATTKKNSQQVYDHILTGEEVLQKGHDYEMDVDVRMYHEKNNVVGYTYNSVKWTMLNRYVTSGYSEGGIAGNLMHEWLHKLGYGHSSASDHSSVPYHIGYMVRDMVEAYQKGARYVDLYPNVAKSEPILVPTPNGTTVEIPAIVVPLPTKVPVKICTRSWKTLWLREDCYYS